MARAKTPWLYPAVVTGSLAPLALLLVRFVTGTLGAEPVAIALNQLGLLALIFLVVSLASTPLKILFGWIWPIALRKTFGLLAFFYACMHFLTYAIISRPSRVLPPKITRSGFATTRGISSKSASVIGT